MGVWAIAYSLLLGGNGCPLSGSAVSRLVTNQVLQLSGPSPASKRSQNGETAKIHDGINSWIGDRVGSCLKSVHQSAYTMPKGIRMVQPSHRIVGDRSETPDKNECACSEGSIKPMRRTDKHHSFLSLLLFSRPQTGCRFKWDWSSA